MSFRIGHGLDVHRFGTGNEIVIGGVKIPFIRSVFAHSDGDVLLHAICDALLGAAALGDIGQHFPDTDDTFKNADSRELLRHVVKLLADKQYAVVNVDATIVAQAPKMAPHIPAMVENIAADLGVSADAINVKATTTEKLGAIGRIEGIAAQAVVLLENGEGDSGSGVRG